MTLELWRPQLEDILAHDVDRTIALSTIPAVQAIWPVVQQAGDAADVVKAALVYSLYETAVVGVDGVPHAKWELTRIARNPSFDPEQDDPDEALLPCSQTWQEFCLVHLGMSGSTASKYKRIWEVYHHRLGYGLDDLLTSGVFKLGSAVALVDRQLREDGVNAKLIEALFGDEHSCSACGGYVPFADEAPAVCPHCGENYQGVEPWSGPRTLLLVQQLRGAREEEELGRLDVFASLERAYSDEGQVVSVSLLAECGLGEEAKSSLPSWELPVVPDDAAEGVLGVRESHREALERWLARKFPGL